LQLQHGDILVGPPFPRSGGAALTSPSLDYTRPVLSARYLNRGTREEMGRNRNARLTPTQVDVLRKVLHRSLCYPVRKIPVSMQVLCSLLTRIPFDIPDDTKVPLWAYLDVTVCTRLVRVLAPSPKIEQKEDNFNLTAARALAGMCRTEYTHCTSFD